jgi:hypothetical protein
VGTSLSQDRTRTRVDRDHDWVADVLIAAGLHRALHVLGDPEPHRLEVRVDGVVAELPVASDRCQPCGVEVAARLVEEQAAGRCGDWEVAVYACDADGGDLLVREWRG